VIGGTKAAGADAWKDWRSCRVAWAGAAFPGAGVEARVKEALKGAGPAHLPVDPPTRFELALEKKLLDKE